MSVQYIPQSKTFGQRMTSAAVEGTEPCLKMLATAKGLQRLGYTKEESRGIAMLPPALQETGMAIALEKRQREAESYQSTVRSGFVVIGNAPSHVQTANFQNNAIIVLLSLMLIGLVVVSIKLFRNKQTGSK